MKFTTRNLRIPKGYQVTMRIKHSEAVSRDDFAAAIPRRVGSKNVIPPEADLAHIRLQDGATRLLSGMRQGC